MAGDPFIVLATDVPEQEGHYPAPFDRERLGFFRDLGARFPSAPATSSASLPAPASRTASSTAGAATASR